MSRENRMYASIWTVPGDPDDLVGRYDALRGEIPDASLRFHACLRAPDGIVVVDTCPTREAFQEFRDSEWFADLCRRHGLPAPRMTGYPVHAAFSGGRRVDR